MSCVITGTPLWPRLSKWNKGDDVAATVCVPSRNCESMRRAASSNGTILMINHQLLGKTGLRVADMCLGTMTFGEEWGYCIVCISPPGPYALF